jgi:hypothetical protein
MYINAWPSTLYLEIKRSDRTVTTAKYICIVLLYIDQSFHLHSEGEDRWSRAKNALPVRFFQPSVNPSDRTPIFGPCDNTTHKYFNAVTVCHDESLDFFPGIFRDRPIVAQTFI